MGKKICVYGAGKYGIHTYLRLKQIGVDVDFFADRNENKAGYAIDGKYCITYNKLVSLDKKNVVIIMGVNDHLSLIQHFKELGFGEVYRVDDYIKLNGCNSNPKLHYTIKDTTQLVEMKRVLADAIYKDEFDENVNIDYDFKQIIRDYQIRNKLDENPRS